jgi:L-ascorbate metabolism protein UlaG (beta-lactamase superfamily)
VGIRHRSLAVDWLGYATVRIETPDVTFYLDPGRHGVLDDVRTVDGDLVFVTHIHHYDPDGIERVAREDATVVVYDGVDTADTDRDVTPVADLGYATARIGEGDTMAVGGITARTVPAYNPPGTDHTDDDGEPMHPRGLGVGYELVIGGTSVFWPGDTDVIEEHTMVAPSLLLPPIGGTYTMDRHGAADLAERLDPDLVLPIHYDTFPAIETDSGAFATDVAKRGVPVVLDE